MPHMIVRGAVPPLGANPAWIATPIEADLIPGPGWVYEAPTHAELMAWAGNQARGFVARHSQGAWDPAGVVRDVRGTDWAALQAAAASGITTLPALKAQVLAAGVATVATAALVAAAPDK